MNKRQRKKALRKVLEQGLTLVGFRTLSLFGPSALKAVVSDLAWIQNIRKAYCEYLAKFDFDDPPKPKRNFGMPYFKSINTMDKSVDN